MSITTCPVCGNGELRREIADFRAQFKDDSGEMREVLVRNVAKDVCVGCGEYVLDEEVEDTISAAQRAAMGLLSASELEAFRKTLGKSQEAMSELLGLGKRTWCRWESNDHFQSESFDRYLRLLMFASSNIRALETIVSSKQRGAETPAALAQRFPFIRDVNAAEEFAGRFEAILRNGAFTATS